MPAFKYVVLGGGNAAGYAAKQFVESGLKPGELAIIGEEPVVSYERPALSKAYLNIEGGPRLPGFHTCVGGGGERQTPEWYTEKGISFMTSTKVTSADVKTKTLCLASGETVTYEKLIIATGARPIFLTEFKTPGAELGAIHYLRDEADAAKLVEAMKVVKAAGGKAVVVGGGYIGMEVAAGLASNGIPSTIVMPEDRLLSRLFTPELATFYESYYSSKGISLVKGQMVKGFSGTADGAVSTVNLEATAGGAKSELEASLVVVGVGARPNVEMFKEQLEMGAMGGIKVDGTFKSSQPDVYAIGDVASFGLKMYEGTMLRQEHVKHARQSASHAVKAIYGSATEYDYLPFFYSRVFDLAWVFYGSSEGAEVVTFGKPEVGGAAKHGAYFVKDGKVVGTFLESGSADENAGMEKVARERPAAPADLSAQGVAFAAK